MSSIYEPYYGLVKMTRLPPDPRIRSRAAGKAFATGVLGLLLLTPWLGTIIVGTRLGALIESNPTRRIFPFWQIMYWLQFNRDYKSHALTELVRGSFTLAFYAMSAGAVLSLIWVVVTYMNALHDRTKLSNEKGSDDWATPEEIAALGLQDPNEAILPAGYDIFKGFSRQHRAQRRARATRLRDYDVDRRVAAQDSETVTNTIGED
jgi:type IV secretory pathway TraG/TraD family ATPase VirD4